MSDTSADLTVLRASTADLLAGLAAETWSDADVRVASLCEGWTRGHVLTHLARNADSIARTLAGALRGEIVARYPDGPAGRDRDIEAGACRPMSELLADVGESAEKLDRVFGAVHDAGAWEAPTDRDIPAWRRLHTRLEEVEVHRVDLAGSYTADRWPAPMVVRQLPVLAAGLGERTDAALHVEVAADGSLAPDHVGAVWTTPGADPVEVHGPDWAVLAWLTGRRQATLGRLTATPDLRPWM